MRLFGRNQKQQITHVESPFEDEEELNTPAETDKKHGPYDSTEFDVDENYIDLGSILIPVRGGMNLQLEVSENTKQVMSATIIIEQSSLQLQAFAAPKSAGLWEQISEQLIASLHKQNADVAKKEGRWGTELLARVPAKMPDGSPGWRVARFIGIDGPRWFVRAVIAGQAAMSGSQAEVLEDYLSNVVVNRGDDPMPPRDLLPLKAPAGQQLPGTAPEQPNA